MDVGTLYNVTSSGGISKQNIIKQVAGEDSSDSANLFSNLLGSAIDGINTTNGYLSDAENEKIKLALGQTENTHDLTIALGKASSALQYTIAIRDKFMEAYKEIMQINI